MNRTSAVLASLCLCAAWCTGAGQLEGTIRDSSQAVVPETSVLCVAEDTGFRFHVQSDTEGNYSMKVPEGSYNLIVRRRGFEPVASIGVRVPQGGAIRVDFELKPSSVGETITVLDVPENTQPASTAVTVLKPEEARSFPRNDGAVTGLLFLVPGILNTPASRGEPGQFSSAGARPNTNRFSVDGVNGNNAVAGAGWPSFLPGGRLPDMTALGTTHGLAMLDAIQDVSVDTQSEGTDTVQTPGANIMIHTRSGTNQVHGSFFFNGRAQGLGANDWFTNRYGLGNDAPTLNEEGGSIGGPLRRDRTFFFLSAERLELHQGYAFTTTVPSMLARTLSPAGLLSLLNEFPAPNGPDLTPGISELIGRSSMPAGLRTFSGRIDHQLTESTRAFLRISDTPSWSDSGLTQIALTEYRNRVAAIGLTQTHGSWLHDTRLSYSRNEATSTWFSGDGTNSSPAFYSQYPSLAADFSNIVVGGAGTVSVGQNGHNLQNQWQASHISALQTSRHQTRFGFEYLELQPVRDGPSLSATIAFGTPTNLVFGPFAPVWITYSRPEANSTHLALPSVFAEDIWRIGSRVNLTFGLRASYPKPPSVHPASNLYSVDDSASAVSFAPIQNPRALWTGAAIQLAPRISAAWRLTERGDTVLRAGWSVFHDIGSAAATDQLNGIPYQELQTPTGSPADIYDPSQLLTVQLGYGYSRRLRLPAYQRWNVQIQHDWNHRDSVAVSYTGLSGTGELRREIILDPSASLGALTFASSDGRSQYQGLSFLYKRSLANGLQANVGYTWSHSLDLNSSDSSVFLLSPGHNASTDYGSSDFDVRHALSAAVSYTTPERGRGWAGRLMSRWTFASVISARSGFPVDVLVSETLDGFAIANYRPTQFANVPAWVADASVPGGRALNPNAFGYPLAGQIPIGRNALRGFGMWQADVTAERPVWRRDGMQISFRADAFNVTNHAQFSDPVRYASNPMFGQSQSALNLMFGGGSPGSGQSPAFLMGAPRSLQLAMRFSF